MAGEIAQEAARLRQYDFGAPRWLFFDPQCLNGAADEPRD
jgi:hypothetical protein